MRKLDSVSWPSPDEDAPTLPPGSYSVDFHMLPAEGVMGATVALLGSFRLPYATFFTYGGGMRHAVRIVALDPARGRLFENRSVRVDAAPQHPQLPGGPVPPEPARVDSAHKGAFNCDLRCHLGLPSPAVRYRVFCWVDVYTSPVRAVAVPENPAFHADWPTPEPLPLAPADTSAALRLVCRAGDGGLHARLEGRVAAPAGEPVLYVCARTHCAATFAWRALRLPEAWDGRFALELASLIAPPEGEDLLRLLVCHGEQLSPVLEVPLPLCEGSWEV